MNVILGRIYSLVMNYMDTYRLNAMFIIDIYQRGVNMAYEKDLDDIMHENYICLKCGWVIGEWPYTGECGCEEE